jgi:hypothetical protein
VVVASFFCALKILIQKNHFKRLAIKDFFHTFANPNKGKYKKVLSIIAPK